MKIRKNLMYRAVLLSFLFLLSTISCSEDKKEEPDFSSNKLIYELFRKASEASLLVESISEKADHTLFTLSDKQTIEANNQQCNVLNCEGKEIPNITKSPKNNWVVNGKNLLIPVADATESPIAICIYYTNESVTIFLNNGKTLVLNRKGTDGITSFSFETAKNGMLNIRLACTIKGTNITASLPEGILPTELIADFTFRGESVYVGETLQESGKSINDFSTPVIYSLRTEDGTTIEYTVTIQAIATIPKIFITTQGGTPIQDKENYVTSVVRIEDPSQLYTDGETFSASAGVRGRGNSTWGMPKKPYKIKLNEKARLLGMSKDKEWALLANYSDKSLLRNLTAFEISRITEMNWTPKSISVEFYLNGNYQGVYTLTEQVKVSSERVDIDLVKETDNSGEALTGGYFIELDFHFDEGERFKTDLKQLPLMFKDPDEPTKEQLAYVKNFFNSAEQALYSDHFTNPETGYTRYIDMESFVKYFIVQELTKNCDGNMRGSCYLTLPRNGKVTQPTVWDFDIAFGNANHIVDEGATSRGWDGWYIKTCSPWFDQFFKDPAFVSALKTKWNALKPQLDQLPQFIDKNTGSLQYAQKRNFNKWNIHEIEWPNYADRGSYEGEITFLKEFIVKRLEWLDREINRL